VDDDDNGLVDCRDPSCSAYACVDAPVGWTPIVLSTDPGASCPPNFPITAFQGGTAVTGGDPVTCHPCACDTAPCGEAEVDIFAQANCSTAAAMWNAGSRSTMCHPEALTAGQSIVAQPVAASGPCGATGGGVATMSTATFTDSYLGCQAAAY